jgi:hypothetical protein
MTLNLRPYVSAAGRRPLSLGSQVLTEWLSLGWVAPSTVSETSGDLVKVSFNFRVNAQ